MSINKNTIIRSYGIAFLGCLLITGINAFLDLNNPYEQNTVTYTLLFHFISALGYALPITFLVFYVIRNKNNKVRVQKVAQIVLYFTAMFVGGALGAFLAIKFIIGEYAGLDAIPPYSIAVILGAILLPLIIFLTKVFLKHRTKK